MSNATVQLAKDAVKEIRMRDQYRMRQKGRLKKRYDPVAQNDLVGDSYFEKGVRLLILNNFGYGNHFKIVREAKIYRPSRSKYIQNQLSGKLPEVCEIWFDGKYLCDVSEDMKPDYAIAMINVALINRLSTK